MIRCLMLLASCLPASSAFAQTPHWPDPVAGDVLPYATAGLAHGPLLGNVTDQSVKVWVRTRKAATVEVHCGESLPAGTAFAAKGTTSADADFSIALQLKGLTPETRYFYTVQIDGRTADLRSDLSEPWPSFWTLPNGESTRDEQLNPSGLFNVCFAVGHCASQDPDRSGGMYPSTPAYDTIQRKHGNEVMFGIVNGDVIYEERRDGTLDGIRSNYRLYFSRGRSFSSLFRSLPAYFTFDDHDVGWDIHGCGQIGLGEGRHLIRDIGLQAYQEYLSWANPRGPQSGRVLISHGSVTAGSDILEDKQSDFTLLNAEQVSTIHLGAYTRGVSLKRKRPDAPKNAGVYGLKEIVDQHHLRISPAATATESLDYSIGTHHYYDWQVSNCHFFALDTRGERSVINPQDRRDKSLFILSPEQEAWLLNGIRDTHADFIFLISPDPWVIYHTAAHVGGDDSDDKGDGFPSFLAQRERLLNQLDAIEKPILIFTGDVHASACVKISNNIYEMMCGPLGSTGHPIGTLGNPPRGGPWKSMGRDVSIRWVTGFPNNLPYEKIRNTYYGVVQVNNVLRTGAPSGGYQHTAFDDPQVTVRWHDGYSGRLVYAESISLRDAHNTPNERE